MICMGRSPCNSEPDVRRHLQSPLIIYIYNILCFVFIVQANVFSFEIALYVCTVQGFRMLCWRHVEHAAPHQGPESSLYALYNSRVVLSSV